jgi:hypothetical protein
MNAMQGRGLGEGRTSRRYATGRVCRFDGCDTRLSVYNGTSTCAIHEERRPFYQRSRSGRVVQDAPKRPMEERDVLHDWIRGLAGSVHTA